MNQKVMKPAKLGNRSSRQNEDASPNMDDPRKPDYPPAPWFISEPGVAEKVTISAIDYCEKEFREKDISNVQDLAPYLESPETTWIRVQGLEQTDIIEAVGSLCKVHPLFLEDIVNTSQRPKAEDAGDYFFIIIRMLNYDEKKDSIVTEQLSFVLAAEFSTVF